MDPRYSAQDILLCDLCQKAALQSHCELCQINLCKACVGEHLSDSSKRHNVVPYKQRTSIPNFPKCTNHTQKHCELYCEQCDIPVCSTCIYSGKHKGHDFSYALQKLSSKPKILENDLEELEENIYPTYEEITSDLNSEKVNLEKHYEKLTTAVTKQGEDLHREIDIIINKQKSEIDEMKKEHLAALNKQQKEFKQITLDIKQSIADLKRILDSNDVSLTSAYKSKNVEFRILPPKFNVILPSFSPNQIKKETLNQMFGSLSAFSITKEEHGYTMKTSKAVSSPPVKPLLDKPELTTTIDTRYNLYSVSCLSDEEIWTCGNDKILKLFNLEGKLLKSIQTKSRNIALDIAVTMSGDLVYSDYDTKTVNIVKNKQIQEVIRLQRWIPCENRNLNICVADNGARAVVVVNQAGKLLFRYTGHPSTTKGFFDPHGITTDSQSHILTTDTSQHCIHILDQDGQFLRYIDNCDLQHPWGLCVDTVDNLFVAECSSYKVKKIKYM
ncbi:E3 ubiquitin-protein ligase TRIM36-like [Saccostrea cucullata]|uniref:E3 ubiquitin-protein ligase TRIM36-like n=1 Tax=Saccostrea cuccullata TaxID=36930 RepID=UPI002ED0B611